MYYTILLFYTNILSDQYFSKKSSIYGGLRKSFNRVGKLLKLKVYTMKTTFSFVLVAFLRLSGVVKSDIVSEQGAFISANNAL